MALGGGEPPLAVGVKEPVDCPVLAVDLLDDVLLAQDPPDSDEPLFPLEWGACFVIGVQQELPARWAAPALGKVGLSGRGGTTTDVVCPCDNSRITLLNACSPFAENPH